MTTDYAGDAAALANRLNEVMRSLPPNTQPPVVIMALSAMLGRAIAHLEAGDKQEAFEWAVSLIGFEGGVETPN